MVSKTNLALVAAVLSLSGSANAEEVDLPVPFLEWSVYVLLLFGLVVAIGIFIHRKRGEKSELLNRLIALRGGTVHSIAPEASVTDCVQRMDELRIGAMLVMDHDHLLGIFTERDAMSRVLAAGLDPTATPVSAVMTANLTCVTPNTTLEEAKRLVTHRRIRHLPVVDQGRVVGMVSSGDLAHWQIRNQASEPDDLESMRGI